MAKVTKHGGVSHGDEVAVLEPTADVAAVGAEAAGEAEAAEPEPAVKPKASRPKTAD